MGELAASAILNWQSMFLLHRARDGVRLAAPEGARAVGALAAAILNWQSAFPYARNQRCRSLLPASKWPAHQMLGSRSAELGAGALLAAKPDLTIDAG